MKKTKPSIAEIFDGMNQFQKDLIEEIWQHFRKTGEGLAIRTLYSEHGTQKVRQALSAIKGRGNVGWEESGSKGWTVYHITLLGALLTKEGPGLLSVIERFFQFQRNLFKKEPETNGVMSARIAQELELSPEKVQLLGQLLNLGQAGGSQVPTETWHVSAMKEAESFPETGDLSAQVSEWIFRYYRPEAVVFQDERVAQHSTVRQIDFGNITNLKGDEFGVVLPSTQKTSYWPNTAFIMMWMDKSLPELEDVSNAIKEVCGQFGIKAVRADEVEHQEKITDIILEHIKESQFLIADLTGERPNVYYEVGYAHSLGRHPILCCKEPTRLHFDIAGYNVPGYENVTSLKKLLANRFESLVGKKPKTPKIKASRSRKSRV